MHFMVEIRIQYLHCKCTDEEEQLLATITRYIKMLEAVSGLQEIKVGESTTDPDVLRRVDDYMNFELPRCGICEEHRECVYIVRVTACKPLYTAGIKYGHVIYRDAE